MIIFIFPKSLAVPFSSASRAVPRPVITEAKIRANAERGPGQLRIKKSRIEDIEPPLMRINAEETRQDNGAILTNFPSTLVLIIGSSKSLGEPLRNGPGNPPDGMGGVLF